MNFLNTLVPFLMTQNMKMMRRSSKKTQVKIEILKNIETIVDEYISKNTTMHRETLEMKGEPYRLYRAREKKHGFKYKTMYNKIVYEQAHRFLERHGCKRGWTQEKLDGTYERNPLLDDPKYCKEHVD